MPQISLYIDESTLKRLEKAARLQRLSISKWVAQQIRTSLDNSYPADFAGLFGSITDETFVRPAQPEFTDDIEREEF